jgi:hypothetical protein
MEMLRIGLQEHMQIDMLAIWELLNWQIDNMFIREYHSNTSLSQKSLMIPGPMIQTQCHGIAGCQYNQGSGASSFHQHFL